MVSRTSKYANLYYSLDYSKADSTPLVIHCYSNLVKVNLTPLVIHCYSILVKFNLAQNLKKN